MGRGKRLPPVPLRAEHHADFSAGVRSREGARASVSEMQEKTLSLPLEHLVHRAFLSLPAREGQTTKGCSSPPKRCVRGAAGRCHTFGWNWEAHAASAGGFLLFWTSPWSAVAGGGAGAVSDPCLAQDPPTRRGCGAAVAVLGRRGGAGRCSGLAPSTGARSPAARAARTGLGVGSVAVTQIAILTLRERRRQGG